MGEPINYREVMLNFVGGIIFKVKTSILLQFTWLKVSVVGILSGTEYTMVDFSSVVKINWYNIMKSISLSYTTLRQCIYARSSPGNPL